MPGPLPPLEAGVGISIAARRHAQTLGTEKSAPGPPSPPLTSPNPRFPFHLLVPHISPRLRKVTAKGGKMNSGSPPPPPLPFFLSQGT